MHCCVQDRDEGRLADYGHMTMFSIGSLSGQVLCILLHNIFYNIDCRDGVGWGGVGGGEGGKFNENSAKVIF